MSEPQGTFKSYVNENVSSSAKAKKQKKRETFTSYIGKKTHKSNDSLDKLSFEARESASSTLTDDSYDSSLIEEMANTVSNMTQEPKQLEGEIIVGKAHQVLEFLPYSDHKKGTSGVLFCTNFKVSFLSANRSTYGDVAVDQRNLLIGDEEISLTNIDAVYQVSGGRKKKLNPSNGSSGHVKTLEIHCKDFSIHTYSFKYAAKSDTKQIVTAIVHHAFPQRLDHLFAFDYKGETRRRSNESDGPSAEIEEIKRKSNDSGYLLKDTRAYDTIPSTPSFKNKTDWEVELVRQNAQKGFKVLEANASFRVSPCMPEHVVVPDTLTSDELSQAFIQYEDYRPPMWSYTHENGSSIIRSGYLIPTIEAANVEDRFVTAIQKAHPKERTPRIYELNKMLPSLKEIQNNYEKMRELCMPSNIQEVKETDRGWFSKLDNARWLQVVSQCIHAAEGAVKIITEVKETLILKENDPTDLSGIVSCLAQILLDPYFRTIAGFQSLVEREWVALGHKFTDRNGLIKGSSDTKECPVFLIFLDCVWQLLQQFPSAFEFSETYLTTIWDSLCMGLFENFIFNSARERNIAVSRHASVVAYNQQRGATELMTVWEWNLQFKKEDLSLFYNPLFLSKTGIQLPLSYNNAKNITDNQTLQKLYAKKLQKLYSDDIPSNDDSSLKRVLVPHVSAPHMQFWSQCYCRWVSPLQIIAGGSPSEYLQQCVLVEEILYLQQKVESLKQQTPFVKANRRKSELITSQPITNHTRRFTENVTSSFPFRASGLATNERFDVSSVGFFMESSLILDDTTDLECSMEQFESDEIQPEASGDN